MHVSFGVISAVAFKNAKQFDQAKDAYLKEAEYHTENKAYPSPAEEEIIITTLSIGQYSRACITGVYCICDAADLFTLMSIIVNIG